MSTIEQVEKLEKQLKEVHPSWSNANITAKAVRMHFLNEKDELIKTFTK